MTKALTYDDVAKAYEFMSEVGMISLVVMTQQANMAMTETEWREIHRRLTELLDELRAIERDFSANDIAFRRRVAKARSALAGLQLHARQHFTGPVGTG